MLFNSYVFLFGFLPPTVLVFFLLGRWSHDYARLWLGLASLAFYAWWSLDYVWLIVVSILFNYCSGLAIDAYRIAAKARAAKFALVAGIAGNLALLGYYKYADFFIGSVSALTGADWSLIHLILPLGISFYTFTQIAYLVDTAEGKAQQFGFFNYLLFVTYFPHLLAGPIIHHKSVMPQFQAASTFRPSAPNIAVGLTIFAIGLAKKVLLADALIDGVHPVFSGAQAPLLYDAWAGTLAYTLQLYFDFSGYCDMAIGLSLIFGVRLPLNFNSPYKAVSIIDFWRRWHMTLSTFLRDYLYIPLGGNRKGPTRRYINLYLTMLLGGLWHGAGWTFVIWGALHGGYLIVNHAWRAVFPDETPSVWKRCAYGALTFLAVAIAWVFFRAPDFATAMSILAGLCGMHGVSLNGSFTATGLDRDILWKIVVGLLIVFLLPNSQEIVGFSREASPQTSGGAFFSLSRRALAWTATPQAGVLFGLLFFVCLLKLRQVSEFIYYQF